MIARRIFSLFLRLSTLNVKEIFHVVAVVIIVFVSWKCQTYYTAYMRMRLHFNFPAPTQLLLSSLFFCQGKEFFNFREINSKNILKMSSSLSLVITYSTSYFRTTHDSFFFAPFPPTSHCYSITFYSISIIFMMLLLLLLPCFIAFMYTCTKEKSVLNISVFNILLVIS